MMFRLAALGVLTALLIGCTPDVHLGFDAYNKKDYKAAAEILKQNVHNPVALYYLFEMADSGYGMPKDRLQAIKYLEQSAAMGNAKALAKLGDKALYGAEGVPKDEKRAEGLLVEAIAAGDVDSAVPLSRYYFGSGNRELGWVYLRGAASTPLGKYELARRYDDRDGKLRAIPELAKKYRLEILAMSDVPKWIMRKVKFDLAEYHYYGVSGPVDYKSAASLVRDAEPDDAEALDFYAWLLYRGEGVEANPSKAFEIWNSALQQSNRFRSYGANGLPLAYFVGKGVVRDVDMAKQLIVKPNYWGAGEFWRTLIQREITGECSAVSNLGAVDPGSRYSSIAAIAWQTNADCEADKGFLIVAEGFIREAERLGIPPDSPTREKIMLRHAKGGVVLGMTQAQVKASKWGAPSRVSKSISSSGVTEQWAYSSGNYLYFSDGKLTSIQK